MIDCGGSFRGVYFVYRRHDTFDSATEPQAAELRAAFSGGQPKASGGRSGEGFATSISIMVSACEGRYVTVMAFAGMSEGGFQQIAFVLGHEGSGCFALEYVRWRGGRGQRFDPARRRRGVAIGSTGRNLFVGG